MRHRVQKEPAKVATVNVIEPTMKVPSPWIQLRTTGLKVALMVAVALTSGAIGYEFSKLRPRRPIETTTPYQAVLLSNGSAYFGKLEGLGTSYPVLRDVYYVQSVQNPQTKQVSNILVKRGNEWHQPDRMILNANMIVFVEPVGSGSRVARLIAEGRDH